MTILYTIGTIVIGLAIGLLTGLLRLSRNWLLTAPLVAYVEIFRCTPLLVQIIWFYYALPVVLGINIPATVAATLGAVALYGRVLMPRSCAAGSISIERGQWDAASARSACTAPPGHARYVILPQAVQAHDPALHEPVDHPAEEYFARVDDRG